MKKLFVIASIIAIVSAGTAFAYGGGHRVNGGEGPIPEGAYEHNQHGDGHEIQSHGGGY